MSRTNGRTIRDTGPDVHHTNPVETFHRLVQERLRNGTLTFEQAARQVRAKHPDLVRMLSAQYEHLHIPVAL